MSFELVMGTSLLVLGAGVIFYGVVAKEHPLLSLFGLGVAALGASGLMAGILSPGPVQIGGRIFFWLVSTLAFLTVWRLARRRQRLP